MMRRIVVLTATRETAGRPVVVACLPRGMYPLSLSYQLNGYVPRLAAAADGNRATAITPIR